ncbi:glycosyltransferase [Brucella sp. 458]|uniref:glycosyltransferase n=1 Tax=Brucella sp. 458 TaxID=2821140 RepID=UPI001ADF9936|nr:glycosyltransferase [Brucella sp. 458]QTN98408.1 glycosyltransferase [Brucella sp. 458]
MFNTVLSTMDYSDPWSASYDDRLSMLAGRKRRIAYFYEHPDASTFRYRVLNPVLTLKANQDIDTSAAWFDLRDIKQDMDFLNYADVLIICRARYSAAVSGLIERARSKSIPVLFDCDDLVFDPDRLHLLVDSLNQDQSNNELWDSWFAYVGRISATLRLCDGIITTNQYLAERALEFLPKLRTAIMPNYLNPLQQEYSKKLFKEKSDSNWCRNEKIHIGYFSGSPTHIRDFGIALPAIQRLMDSDPRVTLRVVGFGAFNDEFARFGSRVEYFPLQDFISLQRVIAEVEINIAPLQENQFTNCKSELKFFEAAICGTLTLASPTFAFKNSIQHGITGFLVPSYGWDDALKAAIALVENKSSYAAIANTAASAVIEKYGWNRASENIIDAAFAVA